MLTSRLYKITAQTFLFLAVTANAYGAVTPLSDAPLVTSSNTAVLPNLMFVLDDSGSMDWDYMPDNAKNFSGKYGFNSSQCNGTYYDPNTIYSPPVNSTGGPLNATPTSFTAAYRDGYAIGAGTVDLSTGFTGGSGSGASGISLAAGPAFYYTYSGTQTSSNRETAARLKNYFSSTSTFYTECNSAIGATPGKTVFSKIRLATTPITTITVLSGGSGSAATITVSGDNSTRTKVSSITVNGAQILSAATSSSTTSSTVASRIADGINACTSAATGSCTVSGYRASASGSVVTLSGPAAASTYTPVLTKSGSFTLTATAFPSVVSTSVSGITVNGVQILLSPTASTTSTSVLAASIASGIVASGYSATVAGSVVTLTGPTSASTYTPVITTNPTSGGMTLTTDSFPESTPSKLQNFANWYSYYSNRMLMMKTGAGQAFSPVTDKYRVGFLTMNNNISPGIVDIAPFDAAQRVLWYNKLYASNPGNSTPLREALSHVGQYYAHKFGSITTYKATLTVGGSGSTDVESLKVNGVEIMLDTAAASTSTSTLAANISAQINSLDPSDFGATVAGNVVTISGPSTALGYIPVIIQNGSMTIAATAFTSSTTTAQLNGITPADPMQYSCQQNFTILSTDGYWNGSTTYNLQNSPVGQQDGAEPKPYNDGGAQLKSTTQIQKTETQLFKTTNQLQQLQIRTRSLQRQISQLQTRASTLQTRTVTVTSTPFQRRDSIDSGASYGAWYNVTSCTVDNGGTVRNQCQAAWERRNSGDGGTTYGAWFNSSPTCVVDSSGTTQNQCRTPSTTTYSSWVNAASCTSSSTTECQYAPTAWTNTNSCTAVPPSSGSPYTVAIATGCQTVVSTPYANSPSCTETTTPDVSGSTTQCQYSTGTWSNTSTCTAVAASTAPNYTVGTATDCQIIGASCTPGVNGCQTVTTGPAAVASCTAATAGPGNSYTQTVCSPFTVTPATGVASCSSGTGPGPDYITSSCNTVATGPTAVTSCTAAVKSAGNFYTATTCSAGTGGVSNTLADVAEYYYVTDLREGALGNCTGALGNSVCPNNVRSALDPAAHQHMTTFTLGLGTRGKMVYSPSYLSDTSGDYYSVKNSVVANTTASPPICSWGANGSPCNWPTPASGAVENIDDLWHAAVNGRGKYLSATDPVTLASGISDALAGIETTSGSSAAATTSNPNVTSGDNFVFSSTFRTTEWNGELVRQQLDLETGVTSTAIDWSAQAKLETKASLTAKAASRTIYAYSAGAANRLKAFDEANFGADSNFNTPRISNATDGLTQFLCASASICLSPADQTLASGNALVNFLRGDHSNEGLETDNTKYYRKRIVKGVDASGLITESPNVLGDIVNAEAVYVKGSLFNYSAAGYSDFVTSTKTRQGIVYAAGNDGMLHAFYAENGAGVAGGDEAWAYIPSMMLPNLYKLADKKYSAANYHRYFVDGTPVVGDICPTAVCTGAQWKTILVGGFNKGGRGYYALDITSPASPKALWEFTDTNLGYSFGNPKITRLKDGTWVVMVTSGYNNVPGTPDASYGGDGVGRLYVLNAATGALITSINGTGTISTGIGDTTTPSGLARISVRVVDSTTDNTALAVYGGDLLGNLWRFDVNDDIGAAGYDAQLLTTLRGPTGAVQPITTKPELGDVSGNKMVFVGTGRYLDIGDMADLTVQSIYGIKDPLTAGTVASTAIYANPRSLLPPSTTGSPAFINQTPVNTTCPANSPATICSVGQDVRTSPNNTVDLGVDAGWYLDLPDAGERVNTDPTLSLGTLGFTTNVPNTDACTVGGYSYRYFMDYRTGGSVSTSTTGVMSSKLGNALATRPVYVRLPNGVVVELTRLSTGTTSTSQVPIGSGGGPTRRTSWRELIAD